MKKKILGILLATAMVGSMLSGCATDGSDSEKKSQTEVDSKEDGSRKFAAFVPTMTNPYWVSELGQLEADIEKDGGTLDIFDAQSDQSKQISQVEDAIAVGYDLFFISAFDADGVRPALEAADKADIPVVAIDTSVTDIDLVTCQVTADNAEAGRLAGEALGERLEENAKVGIIGLSVNMDCRARSENFKEGLKEKCPSAEVVFEQEGNGTTDTALTIMDNMIQSYPDLDAVFAINDPSSLGAVAALESAGMLKDVLVASVDGSSDGVDAVKGGKMIGTAAQFPIEVAKTCLENAYKILDGEELGEKEIAVPSLWINEDNCEENPGY